MIRNGTNQRLTVGMVNGATISVTSNMSAIAWSDGQDFVLASLGYSSIQQGGGANQGNNKIYLGWNSATNHLRAQVDSTDIGDIMTSADLARKRVVGGNLNFYVAATGNDANDGLSPATAVRTIQQAASLSFWGYDFSNYNAVINIGPGTYTDPVFIQGMPLGCGAIIFQGNPSNPASVVVNVTNGIAFSMSLGVFCTISGMTISASGSSNLFVSQGYGIAANQAWVNVDHIVMGSCQTSQWNSWNAGVITANGAAVTFAGTSGIGVGTNMGSQIWLVNSTVTFAPGTSYTSGWAYAQGGGTISLNNTSYVGSFTGTRFIASMGGIIGVAGAGINVIPGTLPGQSNPLGWYG